ncbi:helix-turn-helix domain-containing protein [Geodermatophilus nigrescens]
MPYPPRPPLSALPEFAGTALPHPNPAVQRRVESFVVEQYRAGRSLREIAELTDRSFSAVRNILHKHGVGRRGPGAGRIEKVIADS